LRIGLGVDRTDTSRRSPLETEVFLLDELVDAALGIDHGQGFDLNVDLHSVDVDDLAFL
jgi:hypothetical protein